ncbi:energy transducer TonB [Ekhidna sp. To15]|uniref:energy transducer TonB n=1 Tax=Ekhidna sp. To15 TaxID=3395267 RepID=UPI003F525072
MNRFLACILLLLVSQILTAQEKYYFTSFWRLTSEQNASFYRLGIIDKTSQKFVGEFSDYTIENLKIQEGNYTNEGIKAGNFKLYHPNGNLHSEGSYESNQMVGSWEFYHLNGELKQVIDFDKKPFAVISSRDSLDNSVIENGSGSWIQDFSFGTLKGEQEDFKRIGSWTLKLANGDILISEEYDNGQLVGGGNSNINSTFFSEYIPNYLIEKLTNHDAINSQYPNLTSLPDSLMNIDTTLVFTQVEQMPEPVNEYQYQNFIYSKLDFQEETMFSKERKVFLQLKIDRLGNVYDIKTVKGIGHAYDKSAERVMSQTKWIPGYQRGTPVNVTIVRNVSFYVK